MSNPSIVRDEEHRDESADAIAMRPETLKDFVGQQRARENLEIFISAAKSRGTPLDHVLFHGPPGLGKTTLSSIIAREMGGGFKATSGPVIARPGDLAALLTSLDDHDVLFIDEIHRMPALVEEILYPAMEDFHLDLIIGDGPSAKSVRIDLAKFTLIGATTRAGLLQKPLRDRFGIPIQLQFYELHELESIVLRAARLMKLAMDAAGAKEIATRSRGTPRIAGRLLRRVADFAVVAGAVVVDQKVASSALARLDVDARGLDQLDQRYLRAIGQTFSGGPVGVETLAAAISEPRDAIEEIVEPYLIQQGLIQRTPRGRILTPAGCDHIGIKTSVTKPAQLSLI